MRLRPTLALGLVAAFAASSMAAAPTSQQEPGGVDHEMELIVGETNIYDSDPNTGGVNAFSHFSLWDPQTCHSEAQDNRCDRILVQVDVGGTATISVNANYAEVSDYDLIVYEASSKGEAFSAVGQEQHVTTPIPGEGPVATPGDETIEFKANDESYYLAVVYYRAAGGGYSLTADLI